MDWAELYHRLEIQAYRSPHTVRAKEFDLRDFLGAFEGPALEGTAKRPVGQWIRPITIAYLNRFSHQPATAQRRLALLRTFSRFILKHQPEALPLGDPSEAIPWPQVADPEWKGLGEDQVIRLRAGAQDRILIRQGRVTQKKPSREHQHAVRDRAIFEVLLGTALRVGELCELVFDQFDGLYLRQVRRKGGGYQTIRVPTRAREAFQEYMEIRGREAGPLFLSRTSRRIDRTAVTRALKAIAAQAGPPRIDVHPHLLRHTALRAISRRASLEAAIRLSGHAPSSGARYVVRYTSAAQEELERAQEEVLG